MIDRIKVTIDKIDGKMCVEMTYENWTILNDVR